MAPAHGGPRRAARQPGAADEILRALERLGFEWDGPVLRQSTRLERYRAVLEDLRRRGFAYPCGCSRKELEDSALAIDGARIYSGTCRQGLAPGKSARALRLRTHATPIAFFDLIQGEIEQRVEREVGDFVLQRADGIYAYQLAVVVDDLDQGITDVVRGADLLDSTARQIHLQRILGAPQPRYAHVLAILLLAAKFGVPVCPHAGGVGLCEYVQHLAIYDYVAVNPRLEDRYCEYFDHLHEHFVHPVQVVDARYRAPLEPGYSIEMKPESLAAHEFPGGRVWSS